MQFERFVDLVADLPIIETAVFRAFWPSPRHASVAISRWMAAGKLIQLRRGKYVLAERHRRHPLSLEGTANLLVEPSYLSLEWALAHHGLIPEAVFTLTSVTTKRPGAFDTPVGSFRYRHVDRRHYWGYVTAESEGASFLVASPEKALVDFFRLARGPVQEERLEAMRFQNVHRIDRHRLRAYGRRSGGAAFGKLVDRLVAHLDEIAEEG